MEPEESRRREWAQRFYDEMAALRFLPNSPTLMNAGTNQGMLAACFLLPIEDTLESIVSIAQAAATMQKFGNGTGFAFSRLRRHVNPDRVDGDSVGDRRRDRD